MNRYKETFETWNKVAKLYQDNFMGLDLYNDTYDTFCKQIKNDHPIILEIGCGPGNITKYLLDKRPDFKIDAIDISPKMIELAKTNSPKANFKVMDSRKIDNLVTNFDAVVCGFCLPYLSKSDCSKLMKDCNKILADNGIIYLSFVEGDYKNSGYQTASIGDRVYFYYHGLESINKELKENNFRTIKLWHKQYTKNGRAEETHTIIIAKRINERIT
ncbi:MAG TPA: methyltransferase domain-containing protein [Bacteroidia bacterium]|nr:methyltransferase domain-containing protein [Bacteroidia bacterium]